MLPDTKSSADLARDLIDAANKQISEGNAIVQSIREQYRITDHRGPWRTWSPPPPPPLPPDYYLTEHDKHNVQAVVTMLALARATKRRATNHAALRDVRIHLQRLREGRSQAEFLAIVHTECGLGKSRIYELLAFRDSPPKKNRSKTKRIAPHVGETPPKTPIQTGQKG